MSILVLFLGVLFFSKSSLRGLHGVIIVAAIAAVLGLTASPAQGQAASAYIVTSSGSANGRACPRLDCAVLAAVASGTSVTVVQTIEGDSVSGSSQWHRVSLDSGDVYMHSSLLTPAAGEAVPASPDEAPGSSDRSAEVSTEDWVRISRDGFGVSYPGEWTDYTGNDRLLRILAGAIAVGNDWSEDEEADLFGVLQRSLIFADDRSNAMAFVTAHYRGMLPALLSLAWGCTQKGDDLESKCDIVTLDAGQAMQQHIVYAPGTPDEQHEYIYTLFIDRTEFFIDIWGLKGEDESAAFANSIANSLEVQSLDDIRVRDLVHAGTLKQGDNRADLEPGTFHTWELEVYDDAPVTICACGTNTNDGDLDLLLVLRGPDGKVVAQNDDANFLDLNPALYDLDLEPGAVYTLEVHARPGFKSGDYVVTFDPPRRGNSSA